MSELSSEIPIKRSAGALRKLVLYSVLSGTLFTALLEGLINTPFGMGALPFLVPAIGISELLFHTQTNLAVDVVAAALYSIVAYVLLFPVRRRFSK